MDIATVIKMYNVSLFSGVMAFLYLSYNSIEKAGIPELTTSFFFIAIGSILAGFGPNGALPTRVWTSATMVLTVLGYSFFSAGFRSLNYKRSRIIYIAMIVQLFIVLFISVFSPWFSIDRFRAASFHFYMGVYETIACLGVISAHRLEKLKARVYLFAALAASACTAYLGGINILLKDSYGSALAQGFTVKMALHFLIAIFVYAMVKERTELKLQRASELDIVTGIGNRRWAELSIPSSIHQHDVIFMVDIDEFKQINDNYGHFLGDQVLKLLAHEMQRVIRTGDVFARFGGEEFIVFSSALSRVEAISYAERLRSRVQSLQFSNELESLRATVSIGICWNDGNYTDSRELMLHADTALYRAKNSGRNKVMLYETSMKQDEVSGNYRMNMRIDS